MIAEAMEKFREFLNKANDVKLLSTTPDGRTELWQVKGTIQEIIIPPAARSHTVESLDDVIRFASLHSAEISVWHDTKAVIVLLDDADRRERVTFPLRLSPEILALMKWAGKSLGQVEFVKLLSLNLRADEAVVAPFRNLAWRESAHGTVEPDRLGADVEATVQSQAAAGLPGEFTIRLPLYLNLGERVAYDVACEVDIDKQNKTLALCPLPGAVENAFDRSQLSIHERLVEGLAKEGNAYYGSP